MSDQEEIAGESNPFVELAKARAWIDEAAADITRLRADLASAQEREQRMREFAEYLGRIKGAGVQVVGITEGIRKRARAALSAMRGEP